MKESKKAKEHLTKIREKVAQNPSAIFKMTKDDAIDTLRKTREKIWKDKLAIRN